MENCQELILEDVIKIDIYKQNKVTFSVPYNAPAVIEAECTVIADPVLSMTTYDGTRFAVIPFYNTSTLSMTDGRQEMRTMTVRYAAQSYSGLVKLTSWTDNSSGSSSDED